MYTKGVQDVSDFRILHSKYFVESHNAGLHGGKVTQFSGGLFPTPSRWLLISLPKTLYFSFTTNEIFHNQKRTNQDQCGLSLPSPKLSLWDPPTPRFGLVKVWQDGFGYTCLYIKEINEERSSDPGEKT